MLQVTTTSLCMLVVVEQLLGIARPFLGLEQFVPWKATFLEQKNYIYSYMDLFKIQNLKNNIFFSTFVRQKGIYEPLL